MGIFSEIFCWWGGNTWGTRLTIWRQGRLVGKDDFGNRYYEQKKGVGPLGQPRRWVTYTDFAEASKVPAGWHGWLHYTVDTPPTEQNYQPRPWQRPHLMNMTGTPEAYRPPGSILGARRAAQGDRRLQALASRSVRRALTSRSASQLRPNSRLREVARHGLGRMPEAAMQRGAMTDRLAESARATAH